MAGTLVTAVGLAVAGIPAAAETVGPASDALGVVRIAKGAAIEIGGCWTLSGPDVDLGVDQRRGAEIAMDDPRSAAAGYRRRPSASRR